MWSEPPAEPPCQDTLPGSALNVATRSAIVLCGEDAGTTTTRYSLVSRAIGVTIVRSTGLFCSAMPPTITMPPIISALGSPFALLTNWARPSVPAAPPLFSNCTEFTTFADCIADARARPVWSQPPPGFAGIIIFSVPIACACAAPVRGNCAATTVARAPSENSRRSIDSSFGMVRAGRARAAPRSITEGTRRARSGPRLIQRTAPASTRARRAAAS